MEGLDTLRFFGEAGCYVEWDSAADSVRISPGKRNGGYRFLCLGDKEPAANQPVRHPYPQAAAGNTDKVSTLALGCTVLIKRVAL